MVETLYFWCDNTVLKYKFEKKYLLWSNSSSKLNHITKSQKVFTLASGLNKIQINSHRGLYIGLKQRLVKCKQEFIIRDP